MGKSGWSSRVFGGVCWFFVGVSILHAEQRPVVPPPGDHTPASGKKKSGVRLPSTQTDGVRPPATTTDKIRLPSTQTDLPGKEYQRKLYCYAWYARLKQLPDFESLPFPMNISEEATFPDATKPYVPEVDAPTTPPSPKKGEGVKMRFPIFMAPAYRKLNDRIGLGSLQEGFEFFTPNGNYYVPRPRFGKPPYYVKLMIPKGAGLKKAQTYYLKITPEAKTQFSVAFLDPVKAKKLRFRTAFPITQWNVGEDPQALATLKNHPRRRMEKAIQDLHYYGIYEAMRFYNEPLEEKLRSLKENTIPKELKEKYIEHPVDFLRWQYARATGSDKLSTPYKWNKLFSSTKREKLKEDLPPKAIKWVEWEEALEKLCQNGDLSHIPIPLSNQRISSKGGNFRDFAHKGPNRARFQANKDSKTPDKKPPKPKVEQARGKPVHGFKGSPSAGKGSGRPTKSPVAEGKAFLPSAKPPELNDELKAFCKKPSEAVCNGPNFKGKTPEEIKKAKDKYITEFRTREREKKEVKRNIIESAKGELKKIDETSRIGFVVPPEGTQDLKTFLLDKKNKEGQPVSVARDRVEAYLVHLYEAVEKEAERKRISFQSDFDQFEQVLLQEIGSDWAIRKQRGGKKMIDAMKENVQRTIPVVDREGITKLLKALRAYNASPLTSGDEETAFLDGFLETCARGGVENAFYYELGDLQYIIYCPGQLAAWLAQENPDLRRAEIAAVAAHERGHSIDYQSDIPGVQGVYSGNFLKCLDERESYGRPSKYSHRSTFDFLTEITADYWSGRVLARLAKSKLRGKNLFLFLKEALQAYCRTDPEDGGQHPRGEFRINMIGQSPEMLEAIGCPDKVVTCNLNGEVKYEPRR